MKPREPLPIYHSWPLFERERHLALEHLPQCPLPSLLASALTADDGHRLAGHGVGLWECDLADNRLTWSAGVHDIFGVPRGETIGRDEAVALYADESRVAMERLRAHAIRHRRGFTVDVEVRPSLTGSRWMRLIAVPVCDDRKVTRLHGVKLAI